MPLLVTVVLGLTAIALAGWLICVRTTKLVKS